MQLRGVLGVISQIEVKPQVSATDVQSKIEEALRRSAEPVARRISVVVDGTRVKVYGSVRSWAEKEHSSQSQISKYLLK
jgi:osmotically-inducible protein OsmY